MQYELVHLYSPASLEALPCTPCSSTALQPSIQHPWAQTTKHCHRLIGSFAEQHGPPMSSSCLTLFGRTI
eukprot:1144434-Pelagomonas_calceolata.AAC.2